MNILVTICGRAGSKGLKDKNARLFLGYPLIRYTIAAAYLFRNQRSGDSVDICVNSDGDRILNLSRGYGVTCIKRPQALAGDEAPKLPAIRYSLEAMEARTQKQYDYVLDLDITSPLRKTADIENALAKIRDNPGLDAVFSVVEARRNPYFNMVEEINGKPQKVLCSAFTARQQAPAVYDMNASVYCYRRESLLHRLKQSVFDGAFDVFLMKDTAVLDIDSEEDFTLLEVLGRYFLGGEYRELADFVSGMPNSAAEENAKPHH